MQLPSLINPAPHVTRWLRKRQEERDLRKQAKNFTRIVSIAGEYGYAPDSPEVRSIWDDYPPEERGFTLLADFEEDKWREAFNPADSSHVAYRGSALLVKKLPLYITLMRRCGGASRADIVRTHLSDEWEETCDRIVIGSHETTFFSEDVPVVIFYGSGRDSWGRTYNAVDAIETFANVSIDPADVFAENVSFGHIPDLVLRRVNGKWTWPARQPV